MSEPTYSVKEIIELQFKTLGKDITEIKEVLKRQDSNAEKQFARLDNEIDGLRREVEALKQDNAKYKTVWGIGATLGASLIAVISVRFFG